MSSLMDGTALWRACRGGDEGAIDAYLGARGDPDATNRAGTPAWFGAVAQGHLSIVQKFVRAGATVDLHSSYGDTALTLAARWGRFEVVRELVRAGWSPSLADSRQNKTPLQHAQEGQENQWQKVVGLLESPEAVAQLLQPQQQQPQPPPTGAAAGLLGSAIARRRLLRQGRRRLNTAKIIVAGAGHNGKSSLLARFTGEGFDARRPSTPGVKQCQVTVKKPACWKDNPSGAGFTGSFEEKAACALQQQQLQQQSQEQPAEADRTDLPEPEPEPTAAPDAATVSAPEAVAGTESAEPQIARVLDEAAEAEAADDFARKVQEIMDEKGAQLTDDAPTIVVFDFGGQRMYYVLLQIMLTEALTIYVVAVTLEHALDEELGVQTGDELPYPMTYAQNLDFWLSSIHARAPGAKIQIVCTKVDLVSEAVKDERVAAIEELCDGRAYEDQVLPILCVSNKTGEGINEVQAVVEGEAQPYDEATGVGLHRYGQEVPLGWYKFQSITKELQQTKGEKRISLAQARQIARECEVTDDATLFDMLSEFHNIGFLLWCDENETARRLVVLDVQWMVDTMIQLLCQRSIKAKKRASRNHRSLWTAAQTGRFSAVLLPELWPDLTAEERDNMISYMEYFGLCSRLPEQACPDITYLIPSLLPAVKPGAVVWDATDQDKDLMVRFIHANGKWDESHAFLPDTLFNHLVAALVQGVQTVGNAFKHLYADRVVIIGKQRFMVTHDRAQHCLLVKVFDDSSGSPAAVRAHFDQLLPTLLTSFGLQYRFEAHCNHMGAEQLWPLEGLSEDHAMKMLWQPIAEDIPPATGQQLTKKSIVLSCPEFGTLDPDGGPNAGTNKYDSPVMLTVTRLQKLSSGAIQMGFDRAGTSTSDDRDKETWDQLNPQTAVYVTDVTERKELVKRTFWFNGYKAAAKAQMKLACQAFDGTVEIVCLKGGLVTDVEQEEMDTIIADGIEDAKKSGVECQIEKKVMGFYSFVQEYGEPYGVTVESLLMETSADAGLVREHGTPEPQPELAVARSNVTPTAATAQPQPEPQVAMSAGDEAAETPFFALLRQLNVLEYAAVLQEQEICDEEDLRDLTMDELKELGFKLGSRKRVLKWSGNK